MIENSRPEVRLARRSDQERLVRVLVSAFAEDPVFTFMLPPHLKRREDRLRRLFTLEAARSATRGGTWVSTDGSGAAVWFPPGQWQSTPLEDLLQAPRWIALLGSRNPVATRIRTALLAHHREFPPHWYLLYLGTEPGRQSQGVGSALLRPILDRCDQDGTPAYLEASCERNRQLYLRHGFTDLDPMPLPGGGPVMYPMWREPASSRPPAA